MKKASNYAYIAQKPKTLNHPANHPQFHMNKE